MLTAEVIEDVAALEALAPGWDALAETNRQPLATPAWTLGIWRHMRPRQGALRAIAVHDGDDLVAIAPFYADRQSSGRLDYRLIGGILPRTVPLARPGQDRAAAGAVATALAGADPRPDVVAFEGVPSSSVWPFAVRERWPGRMPALARRYLVQTSPTVTLRGHDDYDGWLATKSSNFRGQMRRARRKLEALGGASRWSTEETFAADLASLMCLHADRWEGRGESALIARRSEFEAFYRDLARTDLATGRLRLRMVEIDGEPISAQLFASIGGETIHLNGGWDERHARLKPSLLGILDGLRDAIERGEDRLDLGPGDQPYKQRIADGDDPVAWTALATPGARLPLTVGRLAPMLLAVEVRATAKRALPPAQVERARAVKRRLGR